MKHLFAGLLALIMALPVGAAELGDDGLHKTPWMRDTFKDLREDLDEANAEGKRLVLFFEQRGCIYCTKMHKEVFPREEVSSYIEDNFFVVQLNLHGDIEVTDFDGETMSEKDMARKWGILFTPTIMFIDEQGPHWTCSHGLQKSAMPLTGMKIFNATMRAAFRNAAMAALIDRPFDALKMLIHSHQ